jgi:hypothetical protein
MCFILRDRDRDTGTDRDMEKGRDRDIYKDLDRDTDRDKDMLKKCYRMCSQNSFTRCL